VKNIYKIKILLPLIVIIFITFAFIKLEVQQTPQQKIIGTWVWENDTTFKITFTSSNQRQEYSNNQLVGTNSYSISHSCGTNSDPKFYFLKITDEDGREYCFEINGINANNSGILSLTSMLNGKKQYLIYCFLLIIRILGCLFCLKLYESF